MCATAGLFANMQNFRLIDFYSCAIDDASPVRGIVIIKKHDATPCRVQFGKHAQALSEYPCAGRKFCQVQGEPPAPEQTFSSIP